ncbi:MAG: alpha/beta fold hydrolase [Gemmatimonadetes bacterium]|nr:alpha/beta fold hydrolase [Gemmatimonadota bacterium]
MADYETFELGNLVLQSGATLRNAKLAYKTHGTLSRSKDNVIVYPTFFGGQHTHNEGLIGEGRALDPRRYFIIVPDMLGNGLSSSPSNTPPPYDRARFPGVSLYDNVMCQHRLVTEQFGVERIALVCGFSMGAQQSFHWGALFPDMVERIAPWCGSARTSPHNFVFLEGVKAALCADDAWNGGWYDRQPGKGLRAMARVYAGWAPSQAFYRERVFLNMGFSSLEDYLITGWEGRYLQLDANDILAMVYTWQHGDISDNPLYEGDFLKALGSIKAKSLVMPSRTDQYFPPEDNEIEVGHMPNAELRVIPTIWGHIGGGPGRNPEDTRFIDDALKELLAS